MPIRRVIVVVLDGFGVGALPDAARYHDTGSDTLGNLMRTLDYPPLPHLEHLGLFQLAPDLKKRSTGNVLGCYGRMAEQSRGKDSTIGHWELMGVVTRKPFPTYPRGFPKNLIRKLEQKIGTRVLGNIVASGTEIIQKLGPEHMKTARPIIYTSADSVFQVAAHVSVCPVSKLYRICQIARKLLRGRHGVGRVIARPFIGEPGNFHRTAARRDFSLPPAGRTALDRIRKGGGQTVGIGKIGDLFANRGLSKIIHTRNNTEGIRATIAAIRQQEKKAKLIFTNLVDTDMVWGHRNDCLGYYLCIKELDRAIPEMMSALTDTDVLCVTSDHGCDPTTPSTDHSREYVPLLIYGHALRKGVDLGTRSSFADFGQTVLELLGLPQGPHGKSFAKDICDLRLKKN